MSSFNSPFDVIYKNEQVIEYFKRAIASGSLPHAHIIEGAEGSGKRTLVTAIAKALSPEYADKIESSNEPDIITVGLEGERKTIGVDSIRALKQRASLTPNELDYLMFIIEDADTMTNSAQNSFLKLLEEPPSNVYMFLLCKSQNSLLPTVISRAPIVRMQLFSEVEITDFLINNDKKAAELYNIDREAFEFSVRTAAGSIGYAKKRMSSRSKSSGVSGAYRTVIDIITSLSKNKKVDFYTHTLNLPQKRDELDVIFTCFEEAMRDLMLVKSFSESAKLPSMIFFADEDDARSLASLFTVTSVRKMIDILNSNHEILDNNANIRLLLSVFANELWAASQL